MTETYKALRHDTLRNCREYRRRMTQARKLSTGLGSSWWLRAVDWRKKLVAEQRLLVALRRRGLIGYRQQLTEEWKTKETN